MRRPPNFFICDRSGQKFPRSQLMIEQGTGLRVARKFADPSSYTMATHPQGRMDVRVAGDTQLLDNIRTDTNITNEAMMLVTNDSPTDYITDEWYNPIYYAD